MGRHDQLFKDLLEAFFEDFLRLVVPGVARRLPVAERRLLPREHFTDLPGGDRRELDLVAALPAAPGSPDPAAIVHVEVEARARPGMARRLWEYAMLLRLRHRVPVVSVVLYLQGGVAGAVREAVCEAVCGEEVGTFTYWSFGLSKCRAEEYLARTHPLAWALAALMRPAGGRRAHLKLACLRSIQGSDLDEARRFLLVNCVETYLQLEGEEAAVFRDLLAEEANEEIAAMEMTWAEELERKGLEKGMQEGMRAVLLDLLEERFGTVTSALRRRVAAIESPEELSRLARRVLTAASPEELELGS